MAHALQKITDEEHPIDEKKTYTRKSRTIPLTRDDVKKTLTRIINDMRDKATNGRIRDPDMEKHRRDSARLAIYACSVYLSALKDEQIQEIEERLLILENGGNL